jgi:hypothetical protein
MILAVGFSGIVGITWGAGIKMTNDRLEDGKPSEDILLKYNIIVTPAIWTVVGNKDRRFYIGLMIVEVYKKNRLKSSVLSSFAQLI